MINFSFFVSSHHLISPPQSFSSSLSFSSDRSTSLLFLPPTPSLLSFSELFAELLPLSFSWRTLVWLLRDVFSKGFPPFFQLTSKYFLFTLVCFWNYWALFWDLFVFFLSFSLQIEIFMDNFSADYILFLPEPQEHILELLSLFFEEGRIIFVLLGYFIENLSSELTGFEEEFLYFLQWTRCFQTWIFQ